MSSQSNPTSYILPSNEIYRLERVSYPNDVSKMFAKMETSGYKPVGQIFYCPAVYLSAYHAEGFCQLFKYSGNKTDFK